MKLFNLVFWYEGYDEVFVTQFVDEDTSYDESLKIATDYLREEIDDEEIYEDRILIVECVAIKVDGYKIKVDKE